MIENKIQLSLIIACYNEGPHLEKNLAWIKSVLDKTNYSYEIIIIDDVSTDNTVEIVENFIKANNDQDNFRFFKHSYNQGRGRTVSDGILAAQGGIVGFIDIDLSTNPWYILPLAIEIEKGGDIVIGRRIYKLKFKVLHRWVLSKGYKFLVRRFLGLNLGDTESGCKFFNREKIIPILTQVKDEKWFWDTEIIVRSYLAGLKIEEVPTVFVRESLYTTAKIFRDSWRHFVNLTKLSSEVRKDIKKIK